jgi:hypothetical protein
MRFPRGRIQTEGIWTMELMHLLKIERLEETWAHSFMMMSQSSPLQEFLYLSSGWWETKFQDGNINWVRWTY